MPNPEIVAVLEKAGDWFVDVILKNHVLNTEKLADLDKFTINPMLHPYLAAFYGGEVTPESLARVLVYPRVLGTSITTSFGTNIQTFISDVLADAFGSLSAGVDLEFVDKVDGETKLCQLKLGPYTINKGDVQSIHNDLQGVRNLARTNGRRLLADAFVVGVMYGTDDDLNAHYISLREKHHYPVYVGRDFWQRLTGDPEFFEKLIATITKKVNSVDCKDMLEGVIHRLACDPRLIALARNSTL
jgi:hypothetical protein